MDDREKRIRDRAHQLWLDAGQPDGHEVEHWEKAIGEVDTESNTNSHTPDLRSRYAGSTCQMLPGTEARPESSNVD